MQHAKEVVSLPVVRHLSARRMRQRHPPGPVGRRGAPTQAAQGGYDRDWAHRTLGQVFAEQQGMRFIALGKTTRVDRLYDGIGRTQVELAVTGDAGLLPERRRNRPYSVSLEWWREGNTWKLARLDWR